MVKNKMRWLSSLAVLIMVAAMLLYAVGSNSYAQGGSRTFP